MDIDDRIVGCEESLKVDTLDERVRRLEEAIKIIATHPAIKSSMLGVRLHSLYNWPYSLKDE